MRTTLTILGVGVGIGAVLFLVSLGYGIQKVILERITTADALLTLDVSPGSSSLITLDRSVLDEIRALSGVERVSPVLQKPGQLTVSDITGDVIVSAVDNYYLKYSGTSLQSGANFSRDDAFEMVVSSVTAQLFNYSKPEDIIGQQIHLSLFVATSTDDSFEQITVVEAPQLYTVTGVIRDENVSFALVPLATLDQSGVDEFALAKIKVKTSDHLSSVREAIITKGLTVSALSDTIDQANKIFGIIQLILGLFGLIALVVSAIGMFNTMTIALLERTNEIGIMRSLGVTRRDIEFLFLVESMVIGFLGGVSGIAIGFLGGGVVNVVLNLLARSFGGQSVDIFYSPPWFIVVIMVFSTIIGAVTGIYPARRAGKLNPLEALRYK